MKKTKLKLSKHTIRQLSEAQIAEAAGGCTGCTGPCTQGGFCPTNGCITSNCPPIPPAPASFGPPAQCWP